jgi:hypothetical protein
MYVIRVYIYYKHIRNKIEDSELEQHDLSLRTTSR